MEKLRTWVGEIANKVDCGALSQTMDVKYQFTNDHLAHWPAVVKDKGKSSGLSITIWRSFASAGGEAVLDQQVVRHGLPKYLHVDDGGQFIAFVV